MGFDTRPTRRPRPTLGGHSAKPVATAERITSCKRCRHIIRVDQPREWSRDPHALGLVHAPGDCP